MNQKDFRLCQLGDALPADAFNPPDSPSHGPTLQVWTFHGAQHVKDCTMHYFKRTGKGEPWVREMTEEEHWELYGKDLQHDDRYDMMEVTREMAIDADDRSLEGQMIRW